MRARDPLRNLPRGYCAKAATLTGRHLHKPVNKEILILALIKKLLKFSWAGEDVGFN